MSISQCPQESHADGDQTAPVARGRRLLLTILAAVLATAALLKASELSARDLAENSLLTTRSFLVSLVLFELGLALWMLTGLHLRVTRWVLLFVFLAFFETALYLALTGHTSCPCIGVPTVPPWVAVIFDSAVLLAIALWSPAPNSPTIFSHAGRLLLLCVAYVAAAVPTLVNMVSCAPIGIMPLLRNDPALNREVRIQGKKPSTNELLDELHHATQLRFSRDNRLAQNESPSLGNSNLNVLPAWAVMELMVQRQPLPTRWQKRQDGYHLVPSLPVQRHIPWLMSGIAVLVIATYPVLSFRRRPGSRATEPLTG